MVGPGSGWGRGQDTSPQPGGTGPPSCYSSHLASLGQGFANTGDSPHLVVT